MTRQSIAILRQQLSGHHAEKYLLARQTVVSDYISKYPDYFPKLVSILGLGPEGLLTDDEGIQLVCGNTGLALKLETRLLEFANITEAAHEFHGLKRFLDNATNGIDTLIQQITEVSKLALDDWTAVQGQAPYRSQQFPSSFRLESFSWSPAKMASFSKKERRANDAKTLINLRDRVIPGKQTLIAEKQTEFTKLEKAYHETPEYQQLTSYLTLRDNGNPDTEAVYLATRQVDRYLHLGGSDDGGYEHDILNNPELKAQWYPQLMTFLEKKGVNCAALDVLVGHYYVVKYERGSKSKNNIKTRYIPAETDLVLYNTLTKEIVSIGEVKSNPYDVPHADHQLSRNSVMMSGKAVPMTSGIHYAEYLEPDASEPGDKDKERITGRYLAHKLRIETPILTASDWSDPIRFIIAPPDLHLPGRLHLPSKVATQITHWLYSSVQMECRKSRVAASYIQEKVDTLQDHLCFCEESEIVKRNIVFRVSQVAK